MLDKLFSKRRRPQDSKHYVKSDRIRLSFESCAPVPSSPAPAQDVCPCSDEDLSIGVSIIEPSIPAPILVSDASVEESQRCLPKAASEPPPSPRAPPRSPSTDVEQLYFNNCAQSNPSVLGKSPPHQEFKQNIDLARNSSSCPRKDGKKPAVHSMPLCKIVQSGGGSSAGEAGGAWDADARAQYYHNKLLSTLQVLQNSEETVRVQGESLRVAEARIASLGARADRLRAQLHEQATELRSLRLADKSRVERADVSAATEAQESQQQKVVRCLQTNLAIIEDLYRECFYETVKQEQLIETLRESYLEVRHTRPRHNTRLQDIATEVDNIKLDVSNFLNNSNNDSGVWERGGGGEAGSNGGEDGGDADTMAVGEDLRHMTAQLLRLRNMLTVDCTCGLEEENMRLKNANETLQIQLGDTRQRVGEIKEDTDQYKKETEEKSKELQCIREEMARLEESMTQKNTDCETFSRQLQQSQVSLEDQSEQLAEARRRCASLEAAALRLGDELKRAHHRADESHALGEELRGREAAAAREARALRAELARARSHLKHLDRSHKEQTQASLALQSQLQEAHTRGAALCKEVRDVVAAVHDWLKRHRNRQDKIKEQETIIKSLQHSLEKYQKDDITNDGDDDTCCPKCVATRRRRCRAFESETASCSKCTSHAGERRKPCSGTSGSEMASPSSAPTPPQRLPRTSNFRYAFTGWGRAEQRSASVQRPHRCDAATIPLFDRCASPSLELEQRVSALTAALDHSMTRWAHPR